jgi:photosystem II stability/assembly factor-like uncharacterized protein
VIKSVDGGQNWSKIDNGIADLYIDDLAIDPETPTTLYAGTNHGVYKSRDEGGSWIGVNTDFLNSSVYDLAIDPVTPTTIYAGTDRGIFKSTDGGGKWSAVNNGFIDYNYFGRRDMWICKLVIDPSTPTTLYAGGDLHLFKSTDGGENWGMVSTLNKIPMHVCSMAIDPLKPNILYAVIGDINHGTAVFKSIDGGGSWISINSNIDDIEGMIDVIAIDPKTPTTIYIGVFEGSGGLSRGGVFKSTDGGLHWFNIGPSGTIVNDLAINPQSPNILYAGTNDGIYYLRQVP